jgi:hypothetical protein
MRMRKKSHISLAKLLVQSMDNKSISMFRRSFYYGSILPDCTPSFITRRHTIEDTFFILQREIQKITEDYDVEEGINSYYCRHLGIVTHYVADYFTYPHNKIFTGSVKEHCNYENELKHQFREYVSDFEHNLKQKNVHQCTTAQDISKYILHMHEEYIKVASKVKNDCYYIVEICHIVVEAIIQYFEFEMQKLHRITAAVS